MNVLLAGHGNIGRSFEAILRRQGDPVNLVVCDLKNGLDCFDYLNTHPTEVDAVINLTGMPTGPLLDVCRKHGIDYVDAGIENTTGISHYDYYKQILATPTQSRLLFGFGMNPGLIEHLYFRNRPQKEHIAIVLEFDEAVSDTVPVFNTWSPASYFDEAVITAKYMSTQKQPYVDMTEKMRGNPVEMELLGKPHEFVMIPHEEIFSMIRLEPKCLGACFLYQAPVSIQNFLLKNDRNVPEEEIREIPTLHDVKGIDSVGMLFYDFGDNLVYCRNAGDHAKRFKQFGVNATCWQTACGIYTAMKLLPIMKKGQIATMSDASVMFPNEIDAILKSLDFTVDRIENAVDAFIFSYAGFQPA